MTTSSAERFLLDTGDRLLQISQQLFTLPTQEWLPNAFKTIIFDPAIQLSELFNLFLGQSALLEILEDQSGDTHETVSPPDSPEAVQPGYSNSHTELSHKVNRGKQPTDLISCSQDSLIFNETTSGPKSVESSACNELQSSGNKVQAPGSKDVMFPSLSTVFRTMDALNIPIVSLAGQDAPRPSSQERFIPNAVDLRSTGFQPAPSASKDAGDPTLKSTILRFIPSDHKQAQDVQWDEDETPGPSIPGAERKPSESSPFAARHRTEDTPKQAVAHANTPAPIPPDGFRTTQSASQVAAILRTHIPAEEMSETSFSLQGKGENSSGLASQKDDVLMHIEDEKIQTNPQDWIVLEQLLDKLVDQLELEFIRTYGTSRR